MRHRQSLRQSVAVSALLLAALFLLPLAVIAPFQPELFGREEAGGIGGLQSILGVAISILRKTHRNMP